MVSVFTKQVEKYIVGAALLKPQQWQNNHFIQNTKN
jgi:hypothetical protein